MMELLNYFEERAHFYKHGVVFIQKAGWLWWKKTTLTVVIERNFDHGEGWHEFKVLKTLTKEEEKKEIFVFYYTGDIYHNKKSGKVSFRWFENYEKLTIENKAILYSKGILFLCLPL